MKKTGMILALLLALFLGSCGAREDDLKIKTISYRTSSFGVIFEARIVDLKKGEIKKFYNNDYRKGGDPMDISEIEESEFDIHKIDDVEKFEKRFKNSGFFQWKKEYNNEGMMDGYQWSLNVEFTDGTSKNVSGSNLEPSNFKEVLSTLDK